MATPEPSCELYTIGSSIPDIPVSLRDLDWERGRRREGDERAAVLGGRDAAVERSYILEVSLLSH